MSSPSPRRSLSGLKPQRVNRQRRRAVICTVESLEERVMLTAWIGGSGNWIDAADWSGGAVPDSYDDVTIPAGSDVTISTNLLNNPEGASLNPSRPPSAAR